MYKYLLATVAAAAIATPAMARDGSPYVGIEGGIMRVNDVNARYEGFTGSEDGRIDIDHKLGYDVDAIAGYDFGMFRAEVELSHKRASIDETDPDIPGFGGFFDDGGKARTNALMGNLLLDFGDDASWNFYLGGGVGVARTTYRVDRISFGGTDSNVGYQFIAGARTPVTANLDAGIKYRYFTTKYNLEEGDNEELLGRWKSHSLLASLIYNFAAPVVAPPPVIEAPAPAPAPAPATQTCPDGSVILATDICPAPPPPPPPPAPAPERG